MRVAFTGHRDRIADPDALLNIAVEFESATWVHGGAIGFDSQVAAAAADLGIAQDAIQPDYSRYGKPAPLIRNRQIVDSTDLLVACYDGRRHGGTHYTVEYARRHNKPIRLLAPR